MNWFRSRLAAVFYFLLAAPATLAVLSALPQHAAPRPPASEIVLGIDPAKSNVHWTLGSTVHTHSRRELCSWIRRRARPAARSSWTRQAGIAATIHATRKCTKRFSKAGNTRKSFFDPTAWMGKLRRRDLLPLTCTDFWFYMAANTN